MCMILLLFVHFLLPPIAGQRKEVNLVLLEQLERDPRQWPAIVGWARMRIAQDYLLPGDYQLKFVHVPLQFIATV